MLAFRSFALLVLALAAASEAFLAILFRSSGGICFARVFPPIRPSSAAIFLCFSVSFKVGSFCMRVTLP